MKKNIIIIIMFLIVATGCTNIETKNQYTLPDLNNKTKVEIERELDGAPVTIVYDYVETEANTEGFFIEYGNELEVNDQVQYGEVIYIYLTEKSEVISDTVEMVALPDLNNKSLTEIVGIMNDYDFLLSFSIVESRTIEDDYFVSYGDQLTAGTEIAINSELIINISDNTTIKLPDLSDLSRTEIINVFESLDLTITFTEEDSDSIPDNHFIRFKDYQANEAVDEGSTIEIILAELKEQEQTLELMPYYASAADLIGDSLKAELNNIIDGHTEISYSNVWDALMKTDEDPDNPGNVILLYSGWSLPKFQHGGDSDDWNREHVWAKSHGDFGTRMGAGTDIHHLRPTDVTVNSSRGNKDFDEGGQRDNEAIDCYYDSDSWEPRDEVKGDVARMLFYMAVRYEGENGEEDLELVNKMTTSSDGYGELGKLSVLLDWHLEDPVDDFERNRNEVIFGIQHNRNPFIDHPEFAEMIWE